MSQRLFNLEHQIAKLQEQINLISEENSKLLQAMQEAAGGQEFDWWELLKKANSNPVENFDNVRPGGSKPIRVPKTPKPMGPTPSQMREREALETFRRGFKPQPKPTPPGPNPSTPAKPGPSPTATSRPGFRPTLTPKLPTTPLGRLGVVGAVAATAYGVGTAIDQILHGRPGVPKDQLRPVPTELLPPPIPQMSPTNNQGGGGFKGYSPPGGGVGGGGGIGG